MCQFVEYTYKVKLAKFQLPSFRRSAVANKKALGAGRIGLKLQIGLFKTFQRFLKMCKCHLAFRDTLRFQTLLKINVVVR